MPCTKCKTDFTLLTWKIKCIDCELHHCSKCLRKMHGGLFCDKCLILNKRPPDREKLMELRSKDLRDYLNKNNISTHGLVEKAELVELFYRCSIPVRNRRHGRLSSVFSGSVPNLASQSQEHIHSIRSNIGTNINNVRSYAENALHNISVRVAPPTGNQSTNNSPRASSYGQQQQQQQQSFYAPNFSNGQQNYAYVYTQSTVGGQTNNEIPTQNIHVFTQNIGGQSNNIPSEAAPPQSTQNIPTQQESSSETSSPHKYPKLSDFEKIEELNDLSVKQLKELLTLNRVDYKGCVEKTELLDRATRLWQDNNQHKNEDFDEATVDNLCKICMDAPLDCVILECGHMATCVNCGKRLAECPICRQYVTRVVRTFKA